MVILIAWSKSTSINGHVVRPVGMPIGIAWLVRRESAMREAMMSSIHLTLEARLQTRATGGIRSALVLLHPE